MFKCATCDIECPREMMVVVEELDNDNLTVLEICPMCADYRRDSHENRNVSIVAREMAKDAGFPDMEGMEIVDYYGR